MKHPAITFHSLTPASDVLEAFTRLGKKMPGRIAMVECKNIVERLVKERAAALILPQIEDAVEFHTSVYDTYEGSTDQEAWTDGMDEAIEALLDSYSNSVTQDFIGRFCVSTRFHIQPAAGMKDEAHVLADAFAADVWRVLIHDSDEDAEPPRVLSTAKILSAVGIVQDDLIEVMGDMPANAPQQQEEDMAELRSMNDILNDLHAFYGGEFDEAELKGLFEMASDSDDGLSLSGLVPMGLDMDSAPTLRMFRAKHGPAAPSEFVDALKGAPYEEDATDSAADYDLLTGGGSGPNEDEEQDPELREMMGLPPLPEPASAPPNMAGVHNRPPGVAPPTPRAPGSKAPPLGQVDKRALTLIREHVKMKDEDVAAGIGVSRQTYINYADVNKKPTLVASEAQGEFLRKIVQDAIDGLTEAQQLLG